MDIIIDEAKKRDMRVWILDDAHFPTGFANGWIRDKYLEHRKIYLKEEHLDVIGPQRNASILKSELMNDNEELLGVIASRRVDEGEAVDDTLLDLSDNVKGDFIYWDIPDGYWRVFLIIVTSEGGWKSDYLNPINPVSSRVLIDDLPSASSEGLDINSIIYSLENNKNCRIVPLDLLISEITSLNLQEVSVSEFNSYLRSYHYKRQDLDIFMFLMKIHIKL